MRLTRAVLVLVLAACGGNGAQTDGGTGGGSGAAGGGTASSGGGTASTGGGTASTGGGGTASTGGGTASTGGGTASTGGGTASTGGGTASTDGGWQPADHSPLPQASNPNNGPVLTHPSVHLVFYPNYPNQTQVEGFATAMTTSTYWATTTQQYGVGALSYSGSQVLTGQTAPMTVSSDMLKMQVAQQVGSGLLGPVDPQGIYTYVFPQGTTVTMPNPIISFLTASSCTDFGAYHDTTTVALSDGGMVDVAFAVMPTCFADVGSLTTAMSHELIEAATDPFSNGVGSFNLTGGPKAAYFNVDSDHTIWGAMGGGEIGDLCEFGGSLIYVTPADLGYPVQRTWSNTAAAAGHDPCVPEISGAFFDSAPVLSQTVTFSSTVTGTFTTKGVVIAQNQSQTIDVQLFSDAPTTGPWSVVAEDLLAKQFGIPATLSFAWDKTTGQNGDTLHLTITVTGASLLAGGHAFLITSTLNGRIALWSGLVVEQ